MNNGFNNVSDAGAATLDDFLAAEMVALKQKWENHFVDYPPRTNNFALLNADYKIELNFARDRSRLSLLLPVLVEVKVEIAGKSYPLTKEMVEEIVKIINKVETNLSVRAVSEGDSSLIKVNRLG